MTEQRKKLINRFQSWLDTDPRKQIISAQCANIAEEYAKEQLLLHNVSQQRELCELLMEDYKKILQIEVHNIVDRLQNGLIHPYTAKQEIFKSTLKAINYTHSCKSDSELLKVGKVKEFWQFKNSYLIDKQLNKDPFGFRKDLTDSELVDKYALYLKNNL